ncbi:MAG: outer membrane beta-barrel protein [Calditrichaceae bacterium]|nr:outer membrane beta-barrel protein [Calditrichaceae bacterium]
MKKVTLILVLVFAVMVFFNPVTAQEKEYRAFGIGINVLDLTGLNAGSGSTIYFPINVARGFRLEPLLGFNTEATDYDDENNESSYSDFLIGLGIFPTIRKGSAVIYVGGRFGIKFGSGEYTSPGDVTTEYSDFSFGIGPVLGGEYYFNPHLSLGGEMAIMYSSTVDKTDYEFGDEEDTRVNIETQGLVFVRFYF